MKNACNISRKRSGAVATCGAQPPAVPGVGWFICGLSGFFGVHWGEVGGISTLFLGTQLAVGSIPAHMSRPLNAGYGGTAALCYRHVTLCEHPGGLFAPARPFTHIGGVRHRESSKTGSVNFYTFYFFISRLGKNVPRQIEINRVQLFRYPGCVDSPRPAVTDPRFNRVANLPPCTCTGLSHSDPSLARRFRRPLQTSKSNHHGEWGAPKAFQLMSPCHPALPT